MKKWKTKEELDIDKAERKLKAASKNLSNVNLYSDVDTYEAFYVDSADFMIVNKVVGGTIDLNMTPLGDFFINANVIDNEGDGNVRMGTAEIPFSEILENVPNVEMLEVMQKLITKEIAIRQKTQEKKDIGLDK